MAREQEDVTKGQEQVELEGPMEVEEAGAAKSRDGGDPRASPPLWPPKPSCGGRGEDAAGEAGGGGGGGHRQEMEACARAARPS